MLSVALPPAVVIVHHMRWPVALVLAWVAAHGLAPLGQAVLAVANRPRLWQPLLLGIVAYAALAWLLQRSRHGRSPLSLLMTLEHELAHALVAWMLGLRVHQLTATDQEGGHVLTSGSSWLVLLAPYVLPLALIVPALVLAAAGQTPAWALVLFGVCMAFHVHGSWVETHRQQTDLRAAGWPLSVGVIGSGHVLVGLWALGVVLGQQTYLVRAGRAAWNAAGALAVGA